MEEKIKNIILKIKNEPKLCSEINMNTNILDDIALNSSQMINFLLQIEKEFNIVVDFKTFDFKVLTSLSELCKYLNSMEN